MDVKYYPKDAKRAKELRVFEPKIGKYERDGICCKV